MIKLPVQTHLPAVNSDDGRRIVQSLAEMYQNVSAAVNQISDSVDRVLAVLGQLVVASSGVSHGILLLQHDGILAIESATFVSATLAASTAVRNGYAYVETAPIAAALTIQITVNGVAYGIVLTIADGTLQSNMIGGLPSIAGGGLVNADVTGVGSTEPGRRLTVVILF